MTEVRSSGILLHPTSLPGPDGIGTCGAEAFRFVDFLRQAGQSLWQVLPLGPPGCGNSPYSSFSAFAGNPMLIDLRQLVADGDLPAAALQAFPDRSRIDFPQVVTYKENLFRQAAERFFAAADRARLAEFWQFCDTTFWLHDYALFMALKAGHRGKGWTAWPEPLRRREPAACAEATRKFGSDIGRHKYLQWQFARQWRHLKGYANENGIRIIGDAPIFVAHDSVDVWCNQHLFRLDEKGRPTVVAGVPPDYFSKTGQLWGNPLYNWDALAADGYGWWLARINNDLALCDILRIDHFRGFEACWEVPATEKTAIRGRWVKGPGLNFFEALRRSRGELPIVAEDLGIITPEVEVLREKTGFPGMLILQFAFDSGADNAYLPHNHSRNAVAYTGTHDNDTTLGWFAAQPPAMQDRICDYLRCGRHEVGREMVRTALASVAKMAVVPLQDILELDSSARMNVPGVAEGNWGWRVDADYAARAPADELRRLAALYNRNGRQ